jgi:aquaporin Z
MKAYIAEFIGTSLLIIGGCGAAIFAGSSLGTLGVAIAFGLSLLVIAYAFGHISGAHVNPAVTFALVLSGKFPKEKLISYWAAQLLGGLFGGVVLYVIAKGYPLAAGSHFAANTLMDGTNLLSGFLMEVVMTMILCTVVIETTAAKFPLGFGGVTVGATLLLVHLISIPLTNTSVNPARSLGVAFFSSDSAAVPSLWIFFVAPLIGAILSVSLHKFMEHPMHRA